MTHDWRESGMTRGQSCRKTAWFRLDKKWHDGGIKWHDWSWCWKETARQCSMIAWSLSKIEKIDIIFTQKMPKVTDFLRKNAKSDIILRKNGKSDIIFTQKCRSPTTTPCMIIIYGHHIWSSYMIIIYDHHIWWSYMMIIYDDHRRILSF